MTYNKILLYQIAVRLTDFDKLHMKNARKIDTYHTDLLIYSCGGGRAPCDGGRSPCDGGRSPCDDGRTLPVYELVYVLGRLRVAIMCIKKLKC